jgi:hypothetical protein
MHTIKHIIVFCLLAGLTACQATRTVSSINQDTGIPVQEVYEVLSHVLETNEFPYFLLQNGEIYEIETDWKENKTSLDIMLELGNIFSKPEYTHHYTTYIKYFVSISNTNYRIRGLARNTQTEYPLVSTTAQETIHDVADVLPDSELWADMTFLVSEINKGLGMDPYQFDIEQEILYD